MTRPDLDSSQRILVIRNDKIGDFMLAWPSFAMLKASLPNSEVCALVPAYTKPLAELCPWIDGTLPDPGSGHGLADLQAAVREKNFTAALTLISTTRIGWLCWRARIPYRLAPATKLAQIFYNHRLTQRRSRSVKPEFEYNLDLVRHFLARQGIQPQLPPPPYLRFNSADCARLKNLFLTSLDIPERTSLVFVHPGSGGSAGNLSIAQYAELLRQLSQPGMMIVLTCGPGEEAMTEKLSALLNGQGTAHRLYRSAAGIVRFAEHIALADLFIAGSTGPLHIAGAQDVPTVGFYPGKRSSTSLRWKPLNSVGRHLSFSPPAGKNTENDMSRIDLLLAAKEIKKFMASFFR